MILGSLLLLAALLVAFANGANDTFKGVATLFGTGRLPYRKALALATVTTLAGSLSAIALSGALVQRFRGKGLVADAVVTDPAFLLAVAVGAAATVLLATRFGFPISTTHALTGGLLGAGLVLAGPARLSYAALGSSFLLPLLLSPVLSLLLAAALSAAFRRAGPHLGFTRDTCLCVGGATELATPLAGAGVLRLPSVAVDRLQNCQRSYAAPALAVDGQTALDSLHVLSAGAVGFARGLNDTPKIAGLLVGAAAVLPTEVGLVAGAMAAGGLLAARRVAQTLSFRITAMDDEQGVSANLATAALVILASSLGLPVSTTHVSCGALFGIGAATGQARWGTIAQILAAWFTTLPLAAALAAVTALVAPALLAGEP